MASRETRSRRLALLYSDGSLTVFSNDVDLRKARSEAISCDTYETDPAHFSRIVFVTLSEIESYVTPTVNGEGWL